MDSLVYYGHQYWIDAADPRTKHFPMVYGGIWKILLILTGYLLLIKKLLPDYMRQRKPYQLRLTILSFNTLLVTINGYFFYQLVYRCDYGRRFLDFRYPDRYDFSPKTLYELNLCWWSWISRFLDMLDTVFFVLRKKDNQVTFLHVYHHTAVPLLGWFSLKINPLAPIIGLFGLFNTAIHVLMYSYYSLSLLGPRMRPYLWWKKYITQLQLLQFLICGSYGCVLFCLQTGYPAVWFWVCVGQNPIFFYLFKDFYRKSYKKINTNDFD
ncbi:elongation of very long chain fatty acids protein AAEL008004-like [Oppia nitens]|uniref:elongation of very long chain fatty acids protein AAEL008004-like n=1 Tax=Oppia nitens TaxID=1686743 RepID=UPI0023DC1DC4|nr:elongation of very long chain fatty acids protein AAEL008004-like [Oppia nitens]